MSRSEFFMISFRCDCHKSHPVYPLSWDCEITLGLSSFQGSKYAITKRGILAVFVRVKVSFIVPNHNFFRSGSKNPRKLLQTPKSPGYLFPPSMFGHPHHQQASSLTQFFKRYQGRPQHRIPQVMLRSNGVAYDEKNSTTSCWKRNFWMKLWGIPVGW